MHPATLFQLEIVSDNLRYRQLSLGEPIFPEYFLSVVIVIGEFRWKAMRLVSQPTLR